MVKPGPGHNSQAVDADRLQAFVARIEQLGTEKADLNDAIQQVYLEAKASGFDLKTVRRVVRERKKDSATRQEEEALFEVYARVFGL